jgi:uncharacterized membrane protein YphA (DoxX/SURF4 family)
MKRALIITITAIVAMCALTIVNALAHPSWGIVVDQHQQVYFSDVTISGGDLYILEVGLHRHARILAHACESCRPVAR